MSEETFTSDIVLLHHSTDGTVRVLLVERRWHPFAGRWALPGGFVDAGETHLDAAVRELAEETGLPAHATDLRRVGRYDTPGRDPRGTVITEAFVAELAERINPTAMDDAFRARWWEVEVALAGSLAFDHSAILQDALRVAGVDATPSR